ncbi:MAG: hypothetical protein WA951_05775 [Leeuwenhoekiella sp.]
MVTDIPNKNSAHWQASLFTGQSAKQASKDFLISIEYTLFYLLPETDRYSENF